MLYKLRETGTEKANLGLMRWKQRRMREKRKEVGRLGEKRYTLHSDGGCFIIKHKKRGIEYAKKVDTKRAGADYQAKFV